MAHTMAKRRNRKSCLRTPTKVLYRSRGPYSGPCQKHMGKHRNHETRLYPLAWRGAIAQCSVWLMQGTDKSNNMRRSIEITKLACALSQECTRLKRLRVFYWGFIRSESADTMRCARPLSDPKPRAPSIASVNWGSSMRLLAAP